MRSDAYVFPVLDGASGLVLPNSLIVFSLKNYSAP